MARGDVVSGLASVAARARLVYQPALGVEALITAIACTPTGVAGEFYDVEMFDGTVTAIFMRIRVDTIPNFLTDIGNWRPRLFLTNARWMRIFNGTGWTYPIGYTGIRTK